LHLSAPERLEVSHDLGPFACGKPALDHWLKTRATANQTRGFTVVMVMHEAGRVVGYYGLAPTAIMPNALPRSIRTGQPPNPVPCLLLGQLATDVQWAGRGIGTALLRHALARSLVGARLIGGRALVVRAIDEDAAGFWQRRGFVPAKDDRFTLFRAMPDIAASMHAAGITPDGG
jgi:GNAT superfamily N-acetyltransferase